MDRNQAKEFYPILQAFAEGKTIETRRKPTTDNNGVTKDGWYEFNCWTEMKELKYRINVEYRIKPEPKYRPFKDAEECWAEMLNHQPFGWVVGRRDGVMHLIRSLEYVSVYTSIQYSFKDAFDKLAFADLVPFGVKIDE